ncbi:hypothetical protein OV203_29805 [Nannocystis sp. ILAH1]|uniref:hypothetical protein n=1 Tax=unclassified Nannocystis TaxID=2627009 RepID=UPI00226E095A|nr:MULTISPECIES: hypothetical protein [unclassified Nannocystis]MCY0991380.1 hypothetical protein [Nannocystis sp. ILAH1]MCY1066429.1 hypothetical protein [Nannocystis sp. RBIL2]
MSLWQHLWPPRPRRLERLSDILGAGRDELVTFAGSVEPLEAIHDPVSGELAVAIDYRAAPPHSVVGVAGALSVISRTFHVARQQAVDFLVAEGPHRVLVCVDHGTDLDAFHRDLLTRHGVGMRTERALVRPGDRVCVIGRRLGARPTSPLRDEPHLAVVRAQRFWPLEPPPA